MEDLPPPLPNPKGQGLKNFGTIFGKHILRPWDWGGVGVDPRILQERGATFVVRCAEHCPAYDGGRVCCQEFSWLDQKSSPASDEEDYRGRGLGMNPPNDIIPKWHHTRKQFGAESNCNHRYIDHVCQLLRSLCLSSKNCNHAVWWHKLGQGTLPSHSADLRCKANSLSESIWRLTWRLRDSLGTSYEGQDLLQLI
eukprot:5983213-Amphidinium_carterae.2